MTATVMYERFNRFFIERLLAIHAEYICMEYKGSNFIFINKLLNSLIKSWFSFIKDRMDHAAKDGNTSSIKDNILSFCKDILLRLPSNDKNANTATCYMKNTIKVTWFIWGRGRQECTVHYVLVDEEWEPIHPRGGKDRDGVGGTGLEE
ncbi:hypothetical protein AJ78_05631 [Emergomyces pasteurianus Ep9510]|uniref:Uncharacterized protein n=1 Tax=Emergomyces pasteurianus Ep9510 TaxID=1447872 RepID=A0A1J9Q1B7_9EURO|nr:hypothetical protein AJ78_05631 [Emergomyces pasteurianus Ep9510]